MDLTAFEHLPDESRVWVYQSNREFDEKELAELEVHLAKFAEDWVSHNRALKASAVLLERRFIVLMVDESQVGASGCSIDKSVHFMKILESEYGLDLFDRMLFSYQNEEVVAVAKRDLFAELYASGKINDETLVFNNLIQTKKELKEKWLIPLKESWHANFV